MPYASSTIAQSIAAATARCSQTATGASQKIIASTVVLSVLGLGGADARKSRVPWSSETRGRLGARGTFGALDRVLFGSTGAYDSKGITFEAPGKSGGWNARPIGRGGNSSTPGSS